MASKPDPRIDAYVAAAAPFSQPVVRHLRQLVRAACPEVEETIKWSRPCFAYRGILFCFIAVFKAHLAFGFWHKDMKKVIAADGGKADEALGLLGRITSIADLPDDRTLMRYIKTAMKLHDSGVPTRPKPKPKAALPVPADLTAALRKNRPAAAAWEKFSPSHRREYIEWLVEAKREETRAKRLATTIEWLAAGKSRNWKYENC